jgi:hypothetical protein
VNGLLRRLPATLWLVALWAALWGNLRAPTVLSGIAVAEWPQSGLDDEFHCLFLLCKELMKRKLQAPIRLLSSYDSSESLPRPECSALGGYFRTLVSESSRYQCKLVEFQTRSEGTVLSDDCRAARVLDELICDPWTHLEVRYRLAGEQAQPTRLVKRLSPLNANNSRAMGSAIRQNGVYLITGGFGGVGFLVAEHLVKNYGCNLALVGRSEPGRMHHERTAHLAGANRTDIDRISMATVYMDASATFDPKGMASYLEGDIAGLGPAVLKELEPGQPLDHQAPYLLTNSRPLVEANPFLGIAQSLFRSVLQMPPATFRIPPIQDHQVPSDRLELVRLSTCAPRRYILNSSPRQSPRREQGPGQPAPNLSSPLPRAHEPLGRR